MERYNDLGGLTAIEVKYAYVLATFGVLYPITQTRKRTISRIDQTLTSTTCKKHFASPPTRLLHTPPHTALFRSIAHGRTRTAGGPVPNTAWVPRKSVRAALKDQKMWCERPSDRLNGGAPYSCHVIRGRPNGKRNR
jgi:hypothetical protein